MAVGDALGAGRAGGCPGVGGVPADRRARGRRGAPRVPRARCAGHRGRWTQRRVRRQRPPVRRGAAGSHRDRRRGRRGRREPHGRRPARHLRARPRSRPAGAGPHPRALAPVDGHLHRRRMAGLPGSGSVLHPLRQDRGHGGRPRRRPRRRSPGVHRWRAAGRGRPRPDAALRRVRRHAGDHHRGPPSRASRPVRRATGGVRLRLVGRGRGGLPAHPAPRRHPCRSPAVRPHRIATQPRHRRLARRAPRAGRGRSRSRRRHDGDRGRRVRGGHLARRGVGGALAGAPQRRVGPRGAHPEGLRRRHPRDRRAVEPAPGDLPGGHRRAAGRPPRPGGQRPPLAQLPGRRLPVLHLRRHSPGRRDRSDLRRAVGRRDPRRAGGRREPEPPPRGRSQPGPVRGRGTRSWAGRAGRP